MTPEEPHLHISRIDRGAYQIDTDFAYWVAVAGTLNEFVNGLRVRDYVADVGATLQDLQLAMREVKQSATPAAEQRTWAMSVEGERALEAALKSLGNGEWMHAHEFHPRVGVDRDVLQRLAVRLVQLRKEADTAFGG